MPKNSWNRPSIYLYAVTLLAMLTAIWAEVDRDRFYNSYNFLPILEDIKIDQNATQSYTFDIDFEGNYGLTLLFHRTENTDSILSHAGLRYQDPINNDTSFFADWTIKRPDSTVVLSSDKFLDYHSSTGRKEYLGRGMGYGQMEKGSYILSVTPNKSKPFLNRTSPLVELKCTDLKYKDYYFKSLFAFVIAVLLASVSLFVFLIQVKNKN